MTQLRLAPTARQDRSPHMSIRVDVLRSSGIHNYVGTITMTRGEWDLLDTQVVLDRG